MIRLSINWRLSAFTAIFLPLLLTLGFWQLSRAEEKRELLKSWEHQQTGEAMQVTDLSQQRFANHQKVQLNASFAPERFWLLEARMYRGKPGYEVLMPAFLDNRQWFLVNRGWVEANPDRRVLPSIQTSETRQPVWGEVRLPTDAALIDERDNPVKAWPHRVLKVDFEIMSQQLGQDLYPFIVALDQDHPSALVVPAAAPVNMPPKKHEAYAVQWFALAFVLFILWLSANTNILAIAKSKALSNKK